MHRHIRHLVLTQAALTTNLPIGQTIGCPGGGHFRLRPDAMLFPRTVRFDMDAISLALVVHT